MEGRVTCFSCFRPQAHCVCSLVPPFDAHCDLLILQHPREWRKYYSTAKIVQKAVRNSKVIRGVIFDQSVIENALVGKNAYVLFPSPNALDVESIELSDRNTIVVLDGTWSEAGKILNRNPFLRSLPAISFKQQLRSNYRIRKQPAEGCLSTLESIAHLLKLNAERFGLHARVPSYEGLLAGFNKMVDNQIQHFPRMSGISHARVRLRRGSASRSASPNVLSS